MTGIDKNVWESIEWLNDVVDNLVLKSLKQDEIIKQLNERVERLEKSKTILSFGQPFKELKKILKLREKKKNDNNEE